MKKYDELDDIIPELFQPSDILIFWGKRGKGKSSLAGKFMSEFMKPKNARKDVRGCKMICEELRQAGFNLHPPRDHTVFCDTFFENKGYLTKHQTAYSFNPIEFALPNSIHKTSILVPYGRYFFDEAQDLFDSHLGALPTFVTKSMELSRHPHLFIAIAVQRPMRIHKDIRDLATFVEVVGLKNKFNKYGRLIETEWTCNIIYDNSVLESYLGNKDKSLIDKKVKFIYKGNIFKCYDSNFFMPMFFHNYENSDFELEKCKRTEMTTSGFEDFFKNRVMEIPETYRGKKPKTKESK